MIEKACENCIHYDFKSCSLNGEYVGSQWCCELWEWDEEGGI